MLVSATQWCQHERKLVKYLLPAFFFYCTLIWNTFVLVTYYYSWIQQTMNQDCKLHYILAVLCNCDVKRSHFSKIIKTARNIYLTLSIISFLYRSFFFLFFFFVVACMHIKRMFTNYFKATHLTNAQVCCKSQITCFLKDLHA